MESLLRPPSNQHGAQEEDIDDLIPQEKGPTTAPTSAPDYKTKFLQSCLAANVLTLGKFTLKSGREVCSHVRLEEKMKGNIRDTIAS